METAENIAVPSQVLLPLDEPRTIVLRAGEYAINPRGVWHTADVAGHATAVFITAGQGTEHRPR